MKKLFWNSFVYPTWFGSSIMCNVQLEMWMFHDVSIATFWNGS